MLTVLLAHNCTAQLRPTVLVQLNAVINLQGQQKAHYHIDSHTHMQCIVYRQYVMKQQLTA